MGYSQRQVAKRLGMKSPGRISQWENGWRVPSIRNLLKLSILYRTLVDNLYYDLRETLLSEFKQADLETPEPELPHKEIKNRSP